MRLAASLLRHSLLIAPTLYSHPLSIARRLPAAPLLRTSTWRAPPPLRSLAAMAPRKRSAAEAHDEADYEEQVMDPKLEPEPEENGPFSDEEMQPPPKKHKGAAVGGKRAGAGVSPLKGKGRANEEAAWKCNDWNPSGALHDDHTPRAQLGDTMEKLGSRPESAVRHVVYWMRMRDLRIEDNRALALASELVQQGGKGSHLIVLHVLSPGDFAAHDRSPRRIDFVLRTLAKLREQLAELDIPLYVTSTNERKKIPQHVLELCRSWGASDVTGNIEHEVDELWRDIATVQQGPKAGVHPHFVEDTYVVPPGAVKTNDGRPYSVFSPWNRRWTEHLSKHPELLDESPLPERNDASIRKDSTLGKLFEQEVPESVAGFECEDREYMHKLWPAGSDAARRVLELFIGGKKGQMDFEADATGVDQPMTDDGAKDSKIAAYGTARNILSEHGTSRLSPYLSAGVISARACLRASREVTKGKLQIGRDSGPAMWGVEVAFRDFYGHVLSAWPRVCMSRAYLLKYEDVKWEYDDEKLKAWMAGRTGYPIVDAAQRQGAKQGYMHNRGRMIVAMFLTKHLMQDWRLGEAYFMRSFIDGDFASNNGGWQWSASTGTDPQPYFRIFAPLSQSEKSDPQGEYIRHWVPELRHVKGNAVHAPYERLSNAEFEKLGYPKPIVDHKQARERALRRFKNPGEE